MASQSTDSPADSPAAFPPQIPSLSQWPPSRQGIFSQLPAPLKANNLLSVCQHTLTETAHAQGAVQRQGRKKKQGFDVQGLRGMPPATALHLDIFILIFVWE